MKTSKINIIKVSAISLLISTLISCGPAKPGLGGRQDEEDGQNQPGNPPGGAGSSPINRIDDAKILANLKQHLRLKAKDMGGAGACLFHSLREQITKNELNAVAARWAADASIDVNNYHTLTPDKKVNILRKIAIFEEKKFIETDDNKSKLFSALSADDQKWVLGMARDWYQEVANTSAEKTREWFEANNSAAGIEIMWKYIIDNRAQYWANTSCDTNWSGTAEAVVFSRILNRPLKMYGNDRASLAQGPSFDANGVVQPYFSYNLGKPGSDLLVFQTGGGGHYQMLVK